MSPGTLYALNDVRDRLIAQPFEHRQIGYDWLNSPLTDGEDILRPVRGIFPVRAMDEEH